jgi:hypothetical protein
MSCPELGMSPHVGQQLGYDKSKLPAAISFEPQIIRWKQDMYRQAIQLVFCSGEAKLLEVFRGIGEAPVRLMQRTMNVGALLQKFCDVEERGLDCHAIRLHRFRWNRANGGSELVIDSVVQLAKKQWFIRIRQVYNVLCHFTLHDYFPSQNEAKRWPRFTRIAMALQRAGATTGLRRRPLWLDATTLQFGFYRIKEDLGWHHRKIGP